MARQHKPYETDAWFVCNHCHHYITTDEDISPHRDTALRTRRHNTGQVAFSPLSPEFSHLEAHQVAAHYGAICNACGNRIDNGEWVYPVTATIQRSNGH